MKENKRDKMKVEELYRTLGVILLFVGIMNFFVSLISEEIRIYLISIASMIASAILFATGDIITEIRKK